MDSGVNRYGLPPRCWFGVVASNEFVVYGVREGQRVALLGPSDVGCRQQRWEFRRGEYDEVEVHCEGEYTVELVRLSDGVERLDNTPVAVPVGAAPPTLREQVRALVRDELSAVAARDGFETFEESDDFEVDEDDDSWYSPYETVEMRPDDEFEEAREPVKAAALGEKPAGEGPGPGGQGGVPAGGEGAAGGDREDSEGAGSAAVASVP